MERCSPRRAALAGGAERLGVATATEAAQLRESLPDARIVVLGALSPDELDVALAAVADVTAWRSPHVALIAERAAAAGVRPGIHVKHDSGMGRLGEPDPEEVLRVIEQVAADERVELAGVWTHFATADERGDSFFAEQLERFGARRRPGAGGASRKSSSTPPTAPPPCASPPRISTWSAAALRSTASTPSAPTPPPSASSRRSSFAPTSPTSRPFRPATSAGYGRRWSAPADTFVGVLPIGYGDGVRRGPHQQRRRARCRRAAAAGRDGVDGQRHGRPRRRRRRSRPGTEAVLIGAAGGGADPRRGARAGSRHDQLRDHLRDLGAGSTAVRVLGGIELSAQVAERLAAAPAVRARGRGARRRRGLGRRGRDPRRRAWPRRHRRGHRRRRRPRRRRRRVGREGGRRAALPALRRVRDLARDGAGWRLAPGRHSGSRTRHRG